MSRTTWSRTPRLAAVALLGLGTLALVACSPDGEAATGSQAAGAAAGEPTEGGQPTEIVLYTSEPEDKAREIVDAFTEQHPEISVSVYRAGTGDLTARIATERRSGAVQADVLWAADSLTFDRYAKEGVLTPIHVDTAGVRDDVVGPDGYYVGTRIIPTVIAYNTTAVDQPPTAWADLTGSEWADKITMPNPDVSGAAAFNAAVWYADPNLGAQWFTGLGANAPVIQDSNGPVSQAVAAGTQPVGVVVDYLVRDLRAQGSPIDLRYPSEGVPYVTEPIGMVADTGEAQAAQAFIDFVIGAEGQQIAVHQNYLPVRSDVGTPDGAPAMEDLAVMKAPADIADLQDKAVAAFTSAVG